MNLQRVKTSYFAAYNHPFTGKRVTKVRCGICRASLLLPDKYPLMSIEKPDVKLFDFTSQPTLVQKGVTVVWPVCWVHVG